MRILQTAPSSSENHRWLLNAAFQRHHNANDDFSQNIGLVMAVLHSSDTTRNVASRAYLMAESHVHRGQKTEIWQAGWQSLSKDRGLVNAYVFMGCWLLLFYFTADFFGLFMHLFIARLPSSVVYQEVPSQ